MTSTSQSSEKNKKDRAVTDKTDQSSQSFWNEAANVWIRFDRFKRDSLGVLLSAAGLITLIGTLNITFGSFITPWVSLLRRLLGWGSYLSAALISILGVLILLGRPARSQKIDLAKILALEVAIFSALALLAVFDGVSLQNAENGMAGGVIGWGLAKLIEIALPFPWSLVALILLFIGTSLYGLGIAQLVVKLFDNLLVSAGQVKQENLPVNNENPQVEDANRISMVPSSIPSAVPQFDQDHPAASTSTIKQRGDDLPPLDLLLEEQANPLDQDHIHNAAGLIEKTLAEFGIPSHVIGYRVGPTVTQFAVEPGFVEKKRPDGSAMRQKVRVSQISALSRDLARALSAEQLRIEAPVPGHSFVGIEAPNLKSTMVRLKPLIGSETFRRIKSPLAIALGRDVAGMPVVADLMKMPHLLIAGTTGSGKSVCIQAITACLVLNNRPADLRLVMLDPKMVELVRFNGLPHLIGNVETDLDRMLGVLRWALVEMDNRYRKLEIAHARDLEAYNRRLRRRGEQPLPRIVILVDELADLMMSAPDQTQHSLVRLAQMARATGIHLVIATQRPSTDVVTGVIKANFPARASFTVATSVDSRVILDTNGAEHLLGHGDMLFLDPEIGSPVRAQGVMITDQEMNDLVNFWQAHPSLGEVDEKAPWEDMLGEDEELTDAMLQQAIEVVRRTQKASASLLQRRLHVGYPRAARLIDELEAQGIVGPAQGGGREREVLIPRQDEEDMQDSDELTEQHR